MIWKFPLGILHWSNRPNIQRHVTRIRCNGADGYTYWTGFCGCWNVLIRNDNKQETEETRIKGNNSLSDIMLGISCGGSERSAGQGNAASGKVG